MALLPPQLYSKLEDIAMDIEQGYQQLEDLEQVPEIIRNSCCWSVLRDHIKAAWFLSSSQGRGPTVLLVQLRDHHSYSDSRVVLKAVAAKSAESNKEQIKAEVRIASLFPWHPLMATLLCRDKDEEGNVFMMSPYAGVCLFDIQAHPDWYGYLTEQERTEVYAVLEAHCMTVLALMQQADVRGGHLYRDTKPENLAYDWRTGQFKIIDFGLAMHCSGFDHHGGYTVGFITPEMCAPGKNEQYEAFMGPYLLPGTFNATTDVFLHGLVGLDLIIGLPDELQPEAFDNSSDEGVLHMLKTHHMADFPALINKISSSKARSYLHQAMHKDYKKRLTPAQALRHPFLKEAAAAVQVEVKQTLPAYAEHAASVVTLLEGLKQSRRAMYLAREQQRQWLHQKQQQQSDDEDSSITAPANPVCGRRSSKSLPSLSSSSNKDRPSACSSSPNCNGSPISCGSMASTVIASDAGVVVTVVAAPTTTTNSRWEKKGVEWLADGDGRQQLQHLQTDISNSSTDAASTVPTAAATTAAATAAIASLCCN